MDPVFVQDLVSIFNYILFAVMVTHLVKEFWNDDVLQDIYPYSVV